jgi:hypothetical protein
MEFTGKLGKGQAEVNQTFLVEMGLVTIDFCHLIFINKVCICEFPGR